MKKTLLLLITSVLPALAVAQLGQQAAVEQIEDMLAASSPADAIIQTLVDEGRSLEKATALAVSVAGNGRVKLDLARAGLCAAADVNQATVVGEEVVLVVQSVTALVTDIESLLAAYDSGLCDRETLEETQFSMYGSANREAAGIAPPGNDVQPVSPAN